MIKLISPFSYEFDEPRMAVVKMSRQGLIGTDRRAFEKRAASQFLRDLPRIREKVAADETLVHLLAMGSTEDYGPNRNGDGFRRAICRQYHPTFEKYARFYRHHKNKDPRKSYGRVVKAAWNEPMKRVELLVALNSTESAAKRNGGLVADREMEKLAAGKDIPVSMACRVSHDICSYCRNRAANPSEYCEDVREGGTCKAGGLKHNMGALVEVDDGLHHLHADNPDPKFFDISHVFHPADRIAYVTGVLEKSAAARGGRVKAAEVARAAGISAPYEVLVDSGMLPRDAEEMVKLAYWLSEMESAIAADPTILQLSAGVADVTDEEIPAPPRELRTKTAAVLKTLADLRVCLTPTAFVAAFTDVPREKAAEVGYLIARRLPGIYSRMLSDERLISHVKRGSYTPAAVSDGSGARWACELRPLYSLQPAAVEKRAAMQVLRRPAQQPARLCDYEEMHSDDDAIEQLAEEYAIYKLAFLHALPRNEDFALTARAALVQNHAAAAQSA